MKIWGTPPIKEQEEERKGGLSFLGLKDFSLYNVGFCSMACENSNLKYSSTVYAMIFFFLCPGLVRKWGRGGTSTNNN